MRGRGSRCVRVRMRVRVTFVRWRRQYIDLTLTLTLAPKRTVDKHDSGLHRARVMLSGLHRARVMLNMASQIATREYQSQPRSARGVVERQVGS